MEIKVLAMIHSKKQIEEATVLKKEGDENEYIVETKDGIKCTAIYNYFTGIYYADDKYGIIHE